MKNPKFGRNKIQTFIEFDTPDGRVRFGEESKRMFIEIGESKIYLTDTSGNLTAQLVEAVSGEGLTLEGINLNSNIISLLTGGLSFTPTVHEHGAIATLTATEIVGTAAGDIGHADGAILVAAPGAGYALEFVSAILIYDHDTAAYTGGADDNVIQNGDGTVALSTTIAGADLLEAAGDKIVQVNALTASDQALVENKPITLKGTALTQPGTAAGVLRVHVTYKKHQTGL